MAPLILREIQEHWYYLSKVCVLNQCLQCLIPQCMVDLTKNVSSSEMFCGSNMVNVGDCLFWSLYPMTAY